jgi:hypothetical protein
MKKSTSKIDVTEIILKHFSTMQNAKGVFYRKDKMYFFIIPFIVGVLLTLILRIPSEGLVNIFTLCLSVFIGLFLNLLVLIISFSENKLKIKDSNNRSILIKETFYNITFTIIASLIGLGLLFIANTEFFFSNWTIDMKFLEKTVFKINKVPVNKIISLFFYSLFYSIFSNIIMTLLMIIKRIFKLFHVDINEAESV